jgi:hypothetical protein
LKVNHSAVIALFVLFAAAACSRPPVQPEPPSLAAEPVVLNVPEQMPALSPEEVVELLYRGHFSVPGGLLRDRAYSRSVYLSKAFIARLDIALSDKDSPLNVDPFTFSQSNPVGFWVEMLEESPDQARLIVHLEWIMVSVDLTIDMVVEDGQWKVDRIQEGNPTTPDGAVRLFYSWYIDYSRAKGSPLVGKGYRSSLYLSDAFINRVDGMYAGRVSSTRDPFTLVSSCPDWISAFPAEPDGETATVTIQLFWEEGEQEQLRKVHLIQHNGRWLIDHVQELVAGPVLPAVPVMSDPAAWERFQDDDYGFSIPVQPDWGVQDTRDTYRGNFEPSDEVEEEAGPIKRTYTLMPEEVRLDIEARTDP